MQSQLRFQITPAVRVFLALHISIWLVIQILIEGYGGLSVTRPLQLVPGQVLFEFHLWQLFTYMFLHSLSVGHLLFNMLTFWLIGVELEQRWGWKKFVFFYLATGVGAALFYCLAVGLFHGIFGGQKGLFMPVIGASGAIFGLLLAYGILFGDRVMHFMFLFPMKAKHFVALLAVVELLSLLSSGLVGGEVAYLAHLGGVASGYLILVGMGRWNRFNWEHKMRKKQQHLKLVVDNEREKEPKYWN